MQSKLLPLVVLLSFLAITTVGRSAAETSDAISQCQSELARQIEVLHGVGFSDQEIRDRLAKYPNEKIRIPREVWFWESELARQVERLYGAGVSDQEIRDWLVKHQNEQIPEEAMEWLAKRPIRKNRPRCHIRLL